MKKIVKGNDFTLRVPVMKMVEGQAQAFSLPACTDVVVQVCNQFRRTPLAFSIDVKEDNVLLARVEGDKMSIGTYAIEVKGKIFGNDWRSNEYPQFAIVANNADADTEFGETDEGDNSVEMDTAMVILPPSVELSDLISDTNEALGKVDGAVSKTDEAVKKANDAVSQVSGALEKVQNVDIDLVGTDLNITRPSGEKKEFDLMQLKGDKGDQGIKGDKGDQGIKGDKGEQGVKGDKGERGEKGDKGNAFTFADFTPEELASLKGEKGDKGLQGERGEQGLPGNDGAKGEAFKYSDFTEEQLAALKGPKGEKGDTGEQGVQGEQGIKGDSFTYDDFTEAEIKELQKPAIEAATKAQTATADAEKVDATLDNDVLTVTNRKGESTSLQLASYAEVGDVVSEVKHLSEAMGAYSDRPDITLVAKETNKAISADGVKVAKTGWAIAEFTAEKGNIYLFKPNQVDGDVCIFAEEITNIETRGIDYTYTYNTDGTIETAKATYLGETHTYTFTYAEDKSYTITDEAGEKVEALPMTYETKVGSYSPLVRLNADAELPIDGYCRYMSHFKGNSSIKIVVSYKIDAADLVMKVVRAGVFASISTQLGNLSQKEDETRSKMNELHRSYADLLFISDWDYLFVDGKKVSVTPGEKMRVYPKFSLKIGKPQFYCPLAWCDVSNLDTSKFTDMSYMFYRCTLISNIDVSRWNVGNVTNMTGLFYDCTSLNSLNIEGWNTSSVSSMTNLFNGCDSITSLNVNNWDISNVAKINGMFAYCSSLKSINLSNWDTRSIIDMSFLFRGYNDLIVDMSGDKWAFNADVMDKLPDSENPFLRWCYSNIKSLLLGKNFFAYDGKFKDRLGDLLNNTFKNWDSSSFKKSIVENTYDRKSNGLSVMTLKLYSTLKNYLTDQDIATITAKGYIIA